MVKSRPIAFQLEYRAYWFLTNYLENKDLSLSSFITSLINSLLVLRTPERDGVVIKYLHEALKVKRDLQVELELTPPKMVCVRIKTPIMEEWDEYCEQKFIKRTSLFKRAIYSYFGLESYSKKDFIRFKSLIGNYIMCFDPVNFFELHRIFSILDKEQILTMLNELEQEGIIGKKGDDGGDASDMLYFSSYPVDEGFKKSFVSELLSQII